MKNITITLLALLVCLVSCTPNKSSEQTQDEETSSGPEWISLFDGQSLDGWQASENKSTFSVKDGLIAAEGPRSHLYYMGEVNNHNFKNFELKVEVMTKPNSNSGIYFHTEYQEEGWPSKGYEVQVNNTHSDWRKTGGLYAIVDVKDPPAKDDEWFTEHIVVNGKNIIIMVDGDTTVNYTEPESHQPPDNMKGRYLSSGTFALQGHDPESKVYYKSVMVKVLPD